MWATTKGICTIAAFGFILFTCEARRSGGWDEETGGGTIPFNLIRTERDTDTLDGLRSSQTTGELDGLQSDPTTGIVAKRSPNPSPSPGRDEFNASNSTKLPFFELKLPDGYNKHEIPKHASGRPMEVLIQCNIRKVLNLDESGESIKIDLEFRIFWTDYKIRDHFNSLLKEKGRKKISFDELTPQQRKTMTQTVSDISVLDTIWKPNLYFGNLLKVTQPYPIAKPVTLKFIPEIGAFELLTRISVLTDCPMDFHYYPADTQECFFTIRPFAYTQTDVKLKWYKTGVWLHELETSSFDVKVGKLKNFSKIVDDEDPLSESFDVFEYRIKSRRRLSYHVVQTYLPSTFYIIITCLCFLLPSKYVEARIGIAMTTLLTLTAMFASVRDSTPIVSYVKAIDTWMAGCIMFVFLTLAEFTFMTWLRSIKEDHEAAEAETNKKTDEVGEKLEMDELVGGGQKSANSSNASAPHKMSPQTFRKYEKLNDFLEKHNFQIFIGILTVYSLIYWIWLLNSANYFDWKINVKYNNVNGDPW